MTGSKPPSGSMVYWRFRTQVPCPWRFGYVTYEKGYDLVRMGCWEWRQHARLCRFRLRDRMGESTDEHQSPDG